MKIQNITIAIIAIIIACIYALKPTDKAELPIIAIANYGSHSSLIASIRGFKDGMKKEGYIDGQNIKFEVADVNFDASLIPQMISKLKSYNPKVMVVMTTPIAQFAKGSVKDIPLIYSVITDPVEAGLIKDANTPESMITGSSEKQDIKLVLEFATKLIPSAKRVGILYSTSESNDIALVKMVKSAALSLNIEVVAIPVDQARDVSIAMQNFNGKVDFIYVGTSGPIQPTLPVIASLADKMKIPVINSDEGAVQDGLVLASFGVNYEKVGANAARLAAGFLNGKAIKDLAPIYPNIADHQGFINKRKANELGIDIPSIENLTIVE